MFTKSGKTWPENQNSCRDKGGYLVSIETEEEWKFISGKIKTLTVPGVNEWHIGLKNGGQQWMWVNGKPLTIEKWQPNEPSGDGNVVIISKAAGLFADVPDHSKKAYICEIPQGNRSQYMYLKINQTPVTDKTCGAELLIVKCNEGGSAFSQRDEKYKTNKSSMRSQRQNKVI